MSKTFENSGSKKDFLEIYSREEVDKYAKPSVTVDSVIFRYFEGRVQTLLIKRKNHPYMGKYALSGGFVQEQEDLNTAVCREVREETSVQLNTDHIEQLVTVGTPYRDPRIWTITIAYLCFMSFNDIQMDKATDDAASTHWLDIAMVNGKLQLTDGDKTLSHDDLAFDHWEILLIAMERIKGRLEYYPTILSIMPKENTLTTYRQLFGTFNETYLKMDSTNFLRRFKHLFQKTGRQVATRTKKAATYTYQIQPI